MSENFCFRFPKKEKKLGRFFLEHPVDRIQNRFQLDNTCSFIRDGLRCVNDFEIVDNGHGIFSLMINKQTTTKIVDQLQMVLRRQ